MSQQDQVVITRRGKPAALMVGVEGKDWEDLVLQASPNFWKLIEERRKEPTMSMRELRIRLKSVNSRLAFSFPEFPKDESTARFRLKG